MSAFFRAVTAPCDTGYEGMARTIPAGETVVVPIAAAAHLAEVLQTAVLQTAVLQTAVLQPAGKQALRISQIGNYTRPYGGQDLDGKRLLAHRGAGIGDQIIFAGCLAHLASRYPRAHIDLLVDQRIWDGLWQGAERLPFGCVHDPLPLAEWAAYDYHWIAGGLCDGDYEPDQPDIWQGHLHSIGHDDAASGCRRPFIPESVAWTQRALAFAEGLRRSSPKLILWHLAASATIRSLSPKLTTATLALLYRARPDIKIIVTGSEEQYVEYSQACELPNVVAKTADLDLQEVFALVGMVDALVCPDSCLGHVSAVFGTPTVSLWCPFPARARVAPYGNHHPIEKRGPCSPCWHHDIPSLLGEIHVGCPLEPAGADSGRWCKGLLAIRPQEIVDKIKEIV